MRRQLAADLALIAVAAIWGTTFTIVKDSLDHVGPMEFLAVRMTLAALCITVVAIARRSPCVSSPGPGMVVGLFLFGGYALQTAGLQYTTASRAAFLTGIYVVIVPLLSGWIAGVRPRLTAWVAVMLALAGTSLLTLPSAARPGLGDIMVLGCAVCFSAQILFVGRFAPRVDTLGFVTMQLWTVAVLSALFAITLEGWRPIDILSLPAPVWIAIGITAVFATTVAFWVQSYTQRFTSPTHTALIFAMEPVFAALYAWRFGGEIMTALTLAGGVLIVGAMALGGIVETVPRSSEAAHSSICRAKR